MLLRRSCRRNVRVPMRQRQPHRHVQIIPSLRVNVILAVGMSEFRCDKDSRTLELQDALQGQQGSLITADLSWDSLMGGIVWSSMYLVLASLKFLARFESRFGWVSA